MLVRYSKRGAGKCKSRRTLIVLDNKIQLFADLAGNRFVFKINYEIHLSNKSFILNFWETYLDYHSHVVFMIVLIQGAVC